MKDNCCCRQFLSHKKTIECLFDEGKQLENNTYKFIYSPAKQMQILIAVSKKKFPLAVTRNKIRRQIREILRLVDNKNYSLCILPNKSFINQTFQHNKTDFSLLYNNLH